MGSWTAKKLIEYDEKITEPVITQFKKTAQQVTYSTFSRKLGTDLLDMVRKKMNYAKDKRSGVTISTDDTTKFYRGFYDEKRALVIENNNKCMVFTYEAGKFGG
ncbi:hypothetical protein [Acinetobacter beijerinckii]|uniref:Uncharacterized protein n=1 Tax=Acinetobacter beijerinckii CIP 110307 TaxID=1217648 RepID=N9DXF7_9GAMM|nr:hypothetical protein [Acinetobacter beijerinckii]ENW02913.1 hypothetical protein F933_03319 [Acinetobacter beijerinckii CIP 110307]